MTHLAILVLLPVAVVLVGLGVVTGWDARRAAREGRAVPDRYRRHDVLLVVGVGAFAVVVALALVELPSSPRWLLWPGTAVGALLVVDQLVRRSVRGAAGHQGEPGR